jgi:Arc/MetJ-type ribon-helix-helix transcriptional regulator
MYDGRLSVSVVVSFRIDRRLKERMEKLRHINWSEVVRRAIEETVRREEARLREKDRSRIAWASARMDELRRRVEGWSSVEEIRRWREARR